MLALEDILLNLSHQSTLLVSKSTEDNLYEYVLEKRYYENNTQVDYHHQLGPAKGNRIDALLGILNNYAYMDQVFYAVRNVMNTIYNLDLSNEINENKQEV